MEISNYTLIEIKAAEGMWLTQTNDVSDEERSYNKGAFIGALDAVDNWREATQEEKDAFDARIEAMFKLQARQDNEETATETEGESIPAETQE